MERIVAFVYYYYKYHNSKKNTVISIKLDLLFMLSMLEEVRRDSEECWPQYSLRQVHTHKYTEMKPRT